MLNAQTQTHLSSVGRRRFFIFKFCLDLIHSNTSTYKEISSLSYRYIIINT